MLVRLLVVVVLVSFYAIHPLLGLSALACVTAGGIIMRRSPSLKTVKHR